MERIGWLVLIAIALGTPVAAQQAELPAQDATSPSAALSLERIRRGLAESEHPLFQRLSRPPDFKTEVVQEQQLSEIVKSLDFRAGPTPFGGLYHYEQQRLLFSPLDYPLMQPYAAFNGAQLITIAIENLFGSYVAPRAIASLAAARHAEAEASAHDEVKRAIAAYCAAQPHRGSGILICEDPSVGR